MVSGRGSGVDVVADTDIIIFGVTSCRRDTCAAKRKWKTRHSYERKGYRVQYQISSFLFSQSNILAS